MGHHRLQSSVQPEAAGRGTLPRVGKAVRASAGEPGAEQQCPLPFLQGTGNADASVRQTDKLLGKERRIFRIELFLPQSAAQADRV